MWPPLPQELGLLDPKGQPCSCSSSRAERIFFFSRKLDDAMPRCALTLGRPRRCIVSAALASYRDRRVGPWAPRRSVSKNSRSTVVSESLESVGSTLQADMGKTACGERRALGALKGVR